MAFEQSSKIIETEIIKKIKLDLYQLIRRYCKSYKITDFEYQLFLHDSTPIEYIVMKIAEVERFISITNMYWSYLPYLISNLSFDEERISVELNDRIMGTIDLAKTNILRMNQQRENAIVCTNNNKNIFTPENILLASIILGINLLAARFMKAGIENQIDEFKIEHVDMLQRISDYTQFLLKDKPLKKLVDYYLLNFENNEELILAIGQRINQNKIRSKYYSLIQFVKWWKNLNWILNERRLSFQEALTPYLESPDDEKLYEIWILYKIISLFEPIYQKDNNTFVNSRTKFSVVYHQTRTLGWFREKYGLNCDVKRYPDILIKKNGLDLAIVDAKCMHYSEKEDDKQEPGPDRNIVNQMIIYLDYDGKCDLGIVLYADDKMREDVVIRQGENRKIIFLNCYPYHESDILSFKKIKNYFVSSPIH
jgi:hypothetical protein